MTRGERLAVFWVSAGLIVAALGGSCIWLGISTFKDAAGQVQVTEETPQVAAQPAVTEVIWSPITPPRPGLRCWEARHGYNTYCEPDQ
jgi:hypothetical protein